MRVGCSAGLPLLLGAYRVCYGRQPCPPPHLTLRHNVSSLSEPMQPPQTFQPLQPNIQAAASDGLFVNLGAVLLQLCAPFLDPSAPLFWKRVDVRYVSKGRLSFAEVGRLGALLDAFFCRGSALDMHGGLQVQVECVGNFVSSAPQLQQF